MTFKKICKILSPLPKPHRGSGPDGLSRQHRSLRPRGGTRQPVVRGPRHAHFAGGRVEPHQGTGKAPRRQAVQPHDAAIDADRARHGVLCRRQAGARSDHRGRGGGERAVGPAARHHPRHRAARSRPAAYRVGHSRLPRQISRYRGAAAAVRPRRRHHEGRHRRRLPARRAGGFEPQDARHHGLRARAGRSARLSRGARRTDRPEAADRRQARLPDAALSRHPRTLTGR